MSGLRFAGGQEGGWCASVRAAGRAGCRPGGRKISKLTFRLIDVLHLFIRVALSRNVSFL